MESESGKFKNGDWVRRVTGSIAPERYGEKGKLYQVKSVNKYNNVDVIGDGFTASPFEFEPWKPAVGDRVRMVKDGLSTTGAVGKLATVERNDRIGANRYLLNIDGPVSYKTLAVNAQYTLATLDCIEPVVGEPTATTTYKIGDRVRRLSAARGRAGC